MRYLKCLKKCISLKIFWELSSQVPALFAPLHRPSVRFQERNKKFAVPLSQQKMSCLLQLDYSNSKHSLINIPTFWWNGQSIFEAASVTFISGYRYSAPPLVSSLFSTPSMLFSTSMLLANPWTYILSSLRADKIWWIFQDNL